MASFEYFRPQSLGEALELLDRAVPLGGGTTLVSKRRELNAVIDLQDLGLDGVAQEDNDILAGATLKLQSIIEMRELFPEALVEACQLETGRNLRNMATLAGRVLACDGRSPLVTSLLALNTRAVLEPGHEMIDLEDLLYQRENPRPPYILHSFRISKSDASVYMQVGRTPADLPIVCTAAARLPSGTNKNRIQIAMGGYGAYPAKVFVSDLTGQTDLCSSAAEAGRKAFSMAADAWASSEYRAEVASILVQRALERVEPCSSN